MVTNTMRIRAVKTCSSARLKVNYRTTDETRKLAVSILENVTVDDLDGGEDSQAFYHSLVHGPDPEVRVFDSMADQADAILTAIREQGFAPEACCVIARTRKEVGALHDALARLGQDCQILDGNRSKHTDGILNIATMHRVKGLEFDAVFVASVNRGLVPLDFVMNSAADAVTRRQRENEERALVYVSLTRARKWAFVFGYGQLSDLFPTAHRQSTASHLPR
jgi:superfamily I DNA/RNA helicase